LFSERRREIVRLLLEYGARFESRGNDHFLELALRQDRELVSLACKRGLDINKRKQGFALLDFALSYQDPALIDFLMELGAERKVQCRWYAVNSAVILRLLAWGVPVPDDVRRAVEDGKW
jgi:ankyrin repeat protein